MEQIISIEFEYRHKTYFALARIREKNGNIEYHITVMNGALEQKLYGNHIFIEEAGYVLLDPYLPGKVTCELRQVIGMALCKHFNKPYHLTERTV
jgi:hypothetical protein